MLGRAILLVLGVALVVGTFVAITGWMTGLGVGPTVASVIGAAAVFGELYLGIKVRIGIGG
ncbi:MAG: hypothetical protein A3K65_09420 [Euryarchaeota archaeon RBG_16_68_12]|nr:MAG: hypothetical protein A3K65_09420 [Euryarchaeota archaeon RBG_16_68_12]